MTIDIEKLRAATTYLKSAMRSRPVIGRADLNKMTLEVER